MTSAGVTPDARRHLRVVLSELFLDTDTSRWLEWRARELAASPFSLVEIERVLIEEVYPVCWSNLWSVAGEWEGFDPAWLEQQITARLESPWRILRVFNVGRLTVPRMAEWKATKARVAAIRGELGRGPA